MDLQHVALDFYERNCVGCQDRRPVRLPNLLALVDQRDADQASRQEDIETARRVETAALAERRAKRELLRRGVDEARLGIYEVIDRLDQGGATDDRRVLREIAIAAGAKFDAPIQEALFDLASAGGWTRTEAALETLSLLAADRQRLGTAALQALARGDAFDVAAAIVSHSLLPEHRAFVAGALPAIVNVAAPSRGPVGFSDRPGDPAALLAVYKLFPELVYDALRRTLTSSSKDDRIDACEALLAIIDVDPVLSLKLAPDLIRSLSLPDDVYDRGSSAHAVARVLALTMRHMPSETDAFLGAALASASETEGAALLDVYIEVLRPEFGGEPRPATAADAIAFRRIVQVFLERHAGERLTGATHFLRNRTESFAALVVAEVETLLGAAALIADDLKERYSPLVDPRPTVEKALEAQTRELCLNAALDAIAHAVGVAMSYRPDTVIAQFLQALSGLGSSHPRLRAALLTAFGALEGSPAAIALVLPVLYSAMTDPHQEIRATSAVVYGKITQGLDPDDLPLLYHETFLTLLRDPYVVVHSSAIRAVRPAALPSNLHVTALGLVAALFVAAVKGSADGRFLSDCVTQLFRLALATDTLTQELREQVVTALSRLPDLLLTLLRADDIEEHDVERLIDELHRLPPSELSSRASLVLDVALRRIAVAPREAIDFVELLIGSGAWGQANEAARALSKSVSDSRADTPRRLRFQALLIATTLETAAARGDYESVVAAASEWAAIAKEIREDDEANEEARRPIRGLRLSN